MNGAGNLVAAGLPYNGAETSGVVVFIKNSTQQQEAWYQLEPLLFPNDYGGIQHLGKQVVMSRDGNFIAFSGEAQSNFTYVWIYQLSQQQQQQQQYQQLGTRIRSTNATVDSTFGGALAFDSIGKQLLVGSAGDNSYAGAVYVYEDFSMSSQPSIVPTNNNNNRSDSIFIIVVIVVSLIVLLLLTLMVVAYRQYYYNKSKKSILALRSWIAQDGGGDVILVPPTNKQFAVVVVNDENNHNNNRTSNELAATTTTTTTTTDSIQYSDNPLARVSAQRGSHASFQQQQQQQQN